MASSKSVGTKPSRSVSSAVSRGSRPSQAKPAPSDTDVALLCGRSSDGEGVDVIRRRADRLEFGTVRPLKDGQPLTSEIVKLVPRKDLPQVCDVEVQWDPGGSETNRAASDRARPAGSNPTTLSNPGVAAGGTGGIRRPAQVATDTYRKNWDTIWKRPESRKLLN